MIRIIILLCSIFSLLTACDQAPSSKKGPGTLAIGQFRFSGSAESGQYAPHLFKLNRVIGQEFAQISGWNVLEKEYLDQAENNKFLTKVWDKVFDENSTPPVPKVVGADYILIGEMDGFDVSINYGGAINQVGSEKVVATVGRRSWVVRSRVSMRIVDTKNQQWLDNQVLIFEEIVADEGSAESQINAAMALIGEKIASSALLSISGAPKVAQLDQDSTIIFNRGSQHGIVKGMIFDLCRVDNELKDPETGEMITVSGRRYTSAEIVEVSSSSSVAKYLGEILPEVGDTGKLAQKKVDPILAAAAQRNIRVAMGGFHSTGLAKVLSSRIPGLTDSLDATIGTRLGKQPGIRLVDQDASRIKQLLAQQMLTDLSKNRQPALPLGTLTGTDYLVFGNLVSLDISKLSSGLSQHEPELEDLMPTIGELHAFLYLQDVNTGENILGEEIKIKKRFKSSEQEFRKRVNILFDALAVTASKRFLFGIRPLRVAWVGLDSVLLNHGADAEIKIGDIFEAFTAGENQIDPYTGAIMQGMGAQLVGRLEVTGFSPQGWATAKCIAGNLPEKGVQLRSLSIKIEPKQQQQKVKAQSRQLNW